MKSFILKFFALFVITISLTFFALIFMQKNQMEKQMSDLRHPMMLHPQMHYIPQMPTRQKEPPIFIPLFIIIFISSLYILFLLKYMNRTFIIPLNNIQKNLKEIKNGNLNIKFKQESENKTISDTYATLNLMIEGLKQKEKLQNEFIQKLSHDLRAPLVAQERAIEILKEEFNDHELLDGLLKNSKEYINMINIVLQSHNQKEIKIDKISFNVFEMVETLIKTFKFKADEKNIKIINEINKNLIIYSDYVSMLRVLGNLISNAIENIPFNKEIKIKALKTQDETILAVEDNGNGIKKENLEKIFDKYSSIGKSEKIVSGLGLFIVKELVEKNSGNIKAISKEGLFTRFEIKLPNEVKNA